MRVHPRMPRGATAPPAKATAAAAAAAAAVLVLGALTSPSAAQIDGLDPVADVAAVGRWSAPFEEGGASVPRCVDDGTGFTVCKPAAYAAAVLPDGRVYYYNGIEGQQNAGPSTVLSTSPTARNSQSRILDLTGARPTWQKPFPDRGGIANPNISDGHQSYDDPQAAIGVPGRPGDGFLGSTAGKAGVPEHPPTSSPDDTADNDGDLFCGEIVSMADGKVLLVGGTDWYNEPAIMDRGEGDPVDAGVIELEGLRNTLVFDPDTDSYTPAGHMKYGRWYPASVVLPDGRVLTAGGVTQLISPVQLGNVRRTETFDPATGTWTENYTSDRSETSLPLLPRLVVAPSGKVFFGGVGQSWSPFGQDAEQAMWNFQQYFDTETAEWELIGPAPLGARSGAFQVALPMHAPYDTMTLITGGGTLGASPGGYVGTPLVTRTVLDANGNVSNSILDPMNQARWFGSGVPLPDGSILVVGGSAQEHPVDPGTETAVRSPELYDARTDTWTVMDSQTRDRTYHHTALLLPDMRVLLGGHSPIGAHYGGPNRDQSPVTANNDSDPSFEIFEPPYLFRGKRPVITAAPAGLAWGSRFTIRTPDVDELENVVLMRTTSVQHVTDGDQRTLVLPFERTGDDRITAVSPPDGVAAPPGYYYLVINRKTPDGLVPSVARMVRVGPTADSDPAPSPFADAGKVAAAGSSTPLDDSSEAAAAQERLAEAADGTPLAPVADAAEAVPAAVGGEAPRHQSEAPRPWALRRTHAVPVRQ
ncbi:MAG: galactose oxidase-like domain-containing protein [Acidimicrobiia bacterium]